MTSPDNFLPSKGLVPTDIYKLQEADPGADGAISNDWLRQVAEVVRTQLLNNLLGGFQNVPQAIQAFIEELVHAITGLVGGDLGDITNWAGSIAANFGDLLQSLLGNYSGADGDLLGIQSWASDLGEQVTNAVSAAVSAAVSTVTDAMEEVISGNIVGALAQSIKAAIEKVIDIIFGSGGSTWSQEVYLVSSQLQIGLNDLPLGFRMGYAGKITNVYVRVLANNATSGSAVLQMRRNAGTFTTLTLSTTDTSKSASGNWACSAGDIIDINCTQVPSAGTISGISVSFVGKYN